MSLQLRRDTAANWTANNPTPLAGQPCFESDTNKLKIGDGVTAYNALAYISGGSAGLSAISGGTTQLTSGTAVFSNSNGVSFGVNGNTVTATVKTDYQTSGAYLTTAMQSNAATISNINFSAGTTSQNLSKITFADSNGVSFGLNGSVVTGTVKTDYQSSGAYLTSQSNQALSGANGSFTFQTASFANSNGVSFSTGTQGMFATVKTDYQSSGAYLTTAMQSNAVTISNINFSAGTTSQNLSKITFADSNGISFGLNGSVVTGTVKTDYQSSNAGYLTSQSNQALSGANGSFTFQTATFANSNGVSFSTGTQGMFATVKTDYQSSGAYLTTAMQSNAATISNINFSAGTTSQNLSKITFADSNGISFGLNGSVVTGTVATNYQSQGAYLTTAMQSNAVTISNINFSAGTTSQNLSKITFADSNGISFGLNGSVVTGTVATNYQSQGAYLTTAMLSNAATISNINLSAGTLSNNLSKFEFANSNGVSFGLSGSTITASAAGGGGGITLSYFNPQDAYMQVAGQMGQSSLMFQPMQAPDVQFDRIAIPMIYTNASNSSNSVSVTQSIGIYTRNASSLSLLFSTYFNTNMSGSGTAGGNYSSHGGLRLATVPITSTLTAGQYWVGMVSQTTANAGGMTISNVVASQMNSSFSGIMGQQTASSIQYTRGLGKYSANTTGFPASVAFSQIYGMSSMFLRQPIFYFVSGTF